MDASRPSWKLHLSVTHHSIHAGIGPWGKTTCQRPCARMDDPVVGADGHTYSRAAVEQWFRTCQSSPFTNQLLSSTNLLPNHTLRKAMAEWAFAAAPSDVSRGHTAAAGVVSQLKEMQL